MITRLLVFCAIFPISRAKLNTTELLEEYGLPSEEHNVMTKDGYIITVFRIPSPGSLPVLVMPGFLSSSNTYAVGPKDQNLVVALADEGFDVWLMNYRGGYYGKKHKTLNPKKDAEKFWDFTFHEIGTLDLPAIIDKVKDVTGKDEVLYVGHSMGGLSFYVMCVERPDYCKKIRAAGLLAPVIFPPSYVDRLSISAGIALVKRFASTARRMGLHELFGNEKDRASSIKKTCQIPIIGKTLCSLSVTVPFSRSTVNVDQKLLPKYIINTLSGTSVKLAEHMTQLMSSDRVVPRFNYGWRKNKQKYKNSNVQFYNGTVNAPIIVFHSKSDPFTDQKAINQLKQVSNVVYDKLITDPTFNHINFLFSNDAKKYIINDLLTLFQRCRTDSDE